MGVVVLAGGTGGAKLARGMLDVAGERLTVIANTADDIAIHGGHVSPDPDLCAFWLADRIDERGWGIAGDTFTVMDELRALGDEVWFSLGDRDLALCIRRARRFAEGATPTEVLGEHARALGLRCRLLPMCDEPVCTQVRTGGEWLGLQEFLIGRRGAAVEDVRVAGIESAGAPAAALAAIEDAEAIVIGPSNPVISIGPILAVPGMRAALAASPAPVVAVSPLVGGNVLKGPTDAFMAWAGRPLDVGGIAGFYEGVIDGIVSDEDGRGLPSLRTDTLLDTPQRRARVAGEALDFARALAG